MINLQERLVSLENENRARKASYPIAGSLVNFVAQYSPTYSFTTSDNALIEKRIKFQANATNAAGRSLVTLSPQVSVSPDFSTSYPVVFYINTPQPGDGSIVLDMTIGAPGGTTTFYFRAIATGSVTGLFTLL